MIIAVKTAASVICLIAICCAASTPSLAQLDSYLFKHLTQDDGLTTDNVFSVTQDANGLWWIGTSNGLQRFDGLNFRNYYHQHKDTTSLPSSYISNVFCDKQNRLWVVTTQGVCRYDFADDAFLPARHEEGIVPGGFFSAFLQGTDQTLWFFTQDTIAYRLSPDDELWEKVTLRLPPGTVTLGRSLWEDPFTNNIWFSCNDGIAFLERVSGKVFHSKQQPDSHPIFPHISTPSSLLIDRQNNFWFINYDVENLKLESIIQYDLATQQVERYERPYGTHLFQSLDGQIWLFPSFSEGVTYGKYDWAHNRFVYKRPSTNEKFNLKYGLGGLRSVFEDREQNIWLATDNGIFIFNPAKQFFSTLPSVLESEKFTPIHNSIVFLESTIGEIWMGTYFEGLYVFDQQFNFLRKYEYPTETTANPKLVEQNFNAVWALHQDKNGTIWAGGQHGTLQQFDSTGKLLKKWRPPAFNLATIRSIAEDAAGNLWFGTQRATLVKWDAQTQDFTPFSFFKEEKTHPTTRIFFDKQGFLLLVSNGYILRFDPNKNQFCGYWTISEFSAIVKDYVAADDPFVAWNDHILSLGNTVHEIGMILSALPSQFITFVQMATTEQVWLGTGAGLARWNPKDGRITQFTTQEGVPISSFTESMAITKLRDGRIVVGAEEEGLFYFHPDSLENLVPPEVLILGLRIFDKPLSLDSLQKKVKLTHQQNFLTIEFAAPSWLQKDQLRFRYRLINFDADWINDWKQRFVVYHKLPPGEYTFQIQAKSRDGLYSEKITELAILILPPLWQRWWAYAVYAALLFGIVFAIYRFQLKRQLAFAETLRLRELDTVKTRLYTNITHEFRTPLTIIAGMADQVLENPKAWFQEGLTMIKRNSHQLLTLVNQLLDLSKLESGSLPVHLIHDDLVSYLKYLAESFQSYAETKGILIHFQAEMEHLHMDFDPKKIETIFTNLIGNAIKFTLPSGNVYLKVRKLRSESHDRLCHIQISDTGIGIAAEKLPYIFDRFYQADDSATRKAEGTGIGLALTKELVKLLEGKIEVESQLGEGTTFTVYLPVRQQAPKVASATPLHATPYRPQLTKEQQIPADQQALKSDQALALLIEDNEDVLHYLVGCLQNQYRLETALDGLQGIEKAIELVPNIIISDVMMPEKDGFEVCQVLKNDERTSHIPIILLTAKADVASRIEGLECGADVYLPKPFDKKELEVQLRKLIELRRKLQARYQNLEIATPAPSPMMEREDAFMKKLRAIVEEHMSKEHFGIPQLCRALGTSRTQLHRKLTALTDTSTSHVIRSIRLQKAKELLQTTDLSVSEIGYATGFSSHSYFTQVFKEEFGEAPLFYRKGK